MLAVRRALVVDAAERAAVAERGGLVQRGLRLVVVAAGRDQQRLGLVLADRHGCEADALAQPWIDVPLEGDPLERLGAAGEQVDDRLPGVGCAEQRLRGALGACLELAFRADGDTDVRGYRRRDDARRVGVARAGARVTAAARREKRERAEDRERGATGGEGEGDHGVLLVWAAGSHHHPGARAGGGSYARGARWARVAGRPAALHRVPPRGTAAGRNRRFRRSAGPASHGWTLVGWVTRVPLVRVENLDEHLHPRLLPGRLAQSGNPEVGNFVADVLHCGGEWVTVPRRGPGWRGSSHSSTPARTLFLATDRASAMDFQGTYEHSLDAKNRLTIPADHRDIFKRAGGGLVLAQGIESCVVDLGARRVRRLRRQGARGQEPDGAGDAIGRALLQHELLSHDARQCEPCPAPAAADRSREPRPGGHHQWRAALPRDLGPRGL